MKFNSCSTLIASSKFVNSISDGQSQVSGKTIRLVHKTVTCDQAFLLFSEKGEKKEHLIHLLHKSSATPNQGNLSTFVVSDLTRNPSGLQPTRS